MISIKGGVSVLGMKPEIILAIIIAGQAYGEISCECVITSGVEGAHMAHTNHRKGLAVDLRINNVPKEKWHPLMVRIQTLLGDQYQVVLEGDHIHIEFDPT
jgi:hypothetical protein